MRINDLVEDREGDKAVVRALYPEGYVGIQWDFDPDPAHIIRVRESQLSNLSERVRELNGLERTSTQQEQRLRNTIEGAIDNVSALDYDVLDRITDSVMNAIKELVGA